MDDESRERRYTITRRGLQGAAKGGREDGEAALRAATLDISRATRRRVIVLTFVELSKFSINANSRISICHALIYTAA